MRLLEELKRVEKKNFRKTAIILVVLAVVLTGFAAYSGVFKLLKPNDFWSYSERLMDGDDSMKGEFATLNVDYLMDYYIQEYTYKENQSYNKKVTTQYYLFPVDDQLSYYVTIIAPSKYFSDFDKISEETWDYIINGTQPETTAKVQGVFTELTDEDLGYAASYFEEALGKKYSTDEIKDVVSPMAIKVDYVKDGVSSSVNVMFIIGYMLILIVFVHQLIRYLTHTYSKPVLKAAGGDERVLAEMDSDYMNAPELAGSVRVGRKYIFGPLGNNYGVMELSDIVWAYSYIVNRKGAKYYYVLIYNKANKKTMFGPLRGVSSTDHIIEALYKARPYIYVGASKENKKLHKHDFAQMLSNINNAEQQYAADMAYGTDYTASYAEQQNYNDAYMNQTTQSDMQNSYSQNAEQTEGNFNQNHFGNN